MEAAQKYPNCQCTLSWQEIRRSNPRTRTGGLGEFLVEGKYEVWVCLQDNVFSKQMRMIKLFLKWISAQCQVKLVQQIRFQRSYPNKD
jgi:hypothetical protein